MRPAALSSAPCSYIALALEQAPESNPALFHTATWRSGYAEDCKSLHPGSIPGVASTQPSPAEAAGFGEQGLLRPAGFGWQAGRKTRRLPAIAVRRRQAIFDHAGTHPLTPLLGARPYMLCKAGRLCYRPPELNGSALFPGSSAVEHSTVNRMVAGSIPAQGATSTMLAFLPPPITRRPVR